MHVMSPAETGLLMAQSGTASWAPLTLGILLMTVILLRRTVRYHRRSGRSPAGTEKATRALPARDDMPLKDAPPEIVRWQVEMHDLARDLKAELDSKMIALETLIQVARQECDQLQLVISQVNQPPAAVTTVPPKPAKSLDSQLPGTTQQRSDAYRLADLGHPPAAIADFIGTSVGDVDLILGCRSLQ